MDPHDPALMAAARLLLERLTDQSQQGPTMGELYESYFACEGKHLHSARHVDFAWRLLIQVKGSDGLTLDQRRAMSLTLEMVEEIRTGLAVSPFSGRPLTPGTRNRNLYLIHRVLNWAARNRKIPFVPVPPAKIEPAKKGLQTCVRTDDEFSRILSCVQHPTLKVFVQVLFDSGMRFGEAIQIRRAQYSRRPGGHGVVQLSGDQTKTAKARRVHLTKRACDAIDSLPDRGPYLFARGDGQTYGYVYFRRLWDEAVERSGFQSAPGERLTMHRLRSSFVARARFLFKWPQPRIMRQTGHTTFSTFVLYGACDEGEMDEAMDEMDARLEIKRIGPSPLGEVNSFPERQVAKKAR